MHYSDHVDQLIVLFFEAEKNLDEESFSESLIAVIQQCFHLPVKGIKTLDKSLLILDSLFHHFSKRSLDAPVFRLSIFIRDYISKESELKQFLISLLNGLYFGDIDLSLHQQQNKRENLELFLLQLLAEHVSRKTLNNILNNLSLDKKVNLIAYSFKYYREGSFIILNQFENLFKSSNSNVSKLLKNLIFHLRRKYYNVYTLMQILLNQSELSEEELKNTLKELEQYAFTQSQNIYALFNQLIPVMIESPIRVFDELENLKQLMNNEEYLPAEKERKEALHRTEELKAYFEPYFANHFIVQDFDAFARVFGFEGHSPLLQFQEEQTYIHYLSDKLSILKDLFENPLKLIQTDFRRIRNYFAFTLSIISHLEALKRNPSKYKEALDRMIFAIPTCGKILANQPSLPSLLGGLFSLVELLNKNTPNKIQLKDYPIFVFDQSEDKLFAKNHRFIGKLNRLYKSSVIHISKNETLLLAQKISVESLLDTTRTGSFGYGGARNCVFLLSPLLRDVYAQYRNLSKIHDIDEKDLLRIFQEDVLESDHKEGHVSNIIFMIDDDTEIPESNLFSQTLFSRELWNHYSFSPGYVLGRGTLYSVKFLNLIRLLKYPKKIFKHTEWIPLPFSVGMCEFLDKPRICVNLPFGGEESHLTGPVRCNPFLSPSIHLAGNRYPSTQWPTRFFVGLEKHLKSYIPYSFYVRMVSTLFDPNDKQGACIFPWNKMNFPFTFNNLKDVFKIISDDKIRKEMQKKFWKNVHHLLITTQKEEYSLSEHISDLIHMDINSILKDFKKNEILNRIEKRSLTEIGNVYKFFQRDAKYLWEFAIKVAEGIKAQVISNQTNVSENWFEACIDQSVNISEIIETIKNQIENLHGIHFRDYPLTEGFYLMFDVVGAAKFNKACSQILSKD